MGAALALSERGRGRTFPNPNVGCVIVKDDRVVGRGWTQPGGRPHAEGMALLEAGDAARGATAFVTLEPCAHPSPRGPACAPSLAEAGIKRVVAALGDPDPRTCGRGFHALRSAGVVVIEDVCADDARRAMAGFLTRQHFGRPHVTLKLAVSLDGCIALANGESRWITGEAARAHVHVERARHDAILVGRGTFEADAPKLDVRLAGLEERSPLRVLLSTQSRHPREGGGPSPALTHLREDEQMDSRLRGNDEWVLINTLDKIATLPANHILVEGGAQTAASFLKADLVDRLVLYTAPILIGGKPALDDLGLTELSLAHGRWDLTESRMLGVDRLQVYERTACLPA
ncbi:Riboflavin biosynthesis protein RibD [Sphingomonas antarctica]|uniref:bifunctional diaminohydroxyphosphoribosylaminopyrimidine deaminase/5-amino-6-(5-phosphoribosylamino)uracil reductase RibD n=1 Tax=Sphingomonas antarctica TaxID=2040274 RepID=UPI0039E888A6